MSKYTTEVRFICETYAGVTESVGFGEVDSVLEKSWNSIFNSTVEFFDENYRKFLCKKILKRYYMREICCETVGLWKFWLNEKLESIMPYYNQLYESARLKFDPLHEVDLIRTHDGTKNEVGKENTTNSRNQNDKTNGNRNTTSNSWDLYSDTPQGSISGLENETYLTNARKINDEENETTSATNETITSETGNKNNNLDSKENYVETVKGKNSGVSYSKLLLEYRETFLNIDNMVIDEFKDLFFNLW